MNSYSRVELLNHIIGFGEHSGKRLTHVPVQYLKDLVKKNHPFSVMAEAELKRRGVVDLSFTSKELILTGHAIDRASQKLWKDYRRTKKENEGLFSWLYRMAITAFKQVPIGKLDVQEVVEIAVENINFVFKLKTAIPTVITVEKVHQKIRRPSPKKDPDQCPAWKPSSRNPRDSEIAYCLNCLSDDCINSPF